MAPRKLRSLALAHENSRFQASDGEYGVVDRRRHNRGKQSKKCRRCQIVARPERTNQVNHPSSGTMEDVGVNISDTVFQGGLALTIGYDNGPQFQPDGLCEYCTQCVIQRLLMAA